MGHDACTAAPNCCTKPVLTVSGTCIAQNVCVEACLTVLLLQCCSCLTVIECAWEYTCALRSVQHEHVDTHALMLVFQQPKCCSSPNSRAAVRSPSAEPAFFTLSK
jgi:hypothetical protein